MNISGGERCRTEANGKDRRIARMRTMFTPLKIAGMEVKNRTFMAPMSLGYESQDGTVNEQMEAVRAAYELAYRL